MRPLRLRINTDIITEFLPPASGASGAAIIVCDGLPSVPSKKHVLEYWSKKGYWVFHPRYRGTWESGGRFLDHDPVDDIIDIARAIRTETMVNAYDASEVTPRVTRVVVVGASFGGAAALLASLHSEVDRVVAISPVIDWTEELYRAPHPLSSLRGYIRTLFGEAYRFSDSDFDRLGRDWHFFNPIAHIQEYNSSKLFIMHAKDDMIVSYDAVKKFIESVPCTHQIVSRGGHFSARVSTQFFLGRTIRNFILG